MSSSERAMKRPCGCRPDAPHCRNKTPPTDPPQPPLTRPLDRPLDIGPFTEIPKLLGTENWHEWYQAISAEFDKQGVWYIVVDAKNVDPKVPPYGLDWPKWKRLDKSLGALLAMTVHRDVMSKVPDGMGGSSLYKHLSTNFKPGPTFSQLVKTLATLHIDQFPSATKYSYEFSYIYSKILQIRPAAISKVMVHALYLEGLGPAWDKLRTKMMEDTKENRRLDPDELIDDVLNLLDDSDTSDEESSSEKETSVKKEMPVEKQISNKARPATEKKPAEKPMTAADGGSADGDSSSDEDMSSDDGTVSDQGVPVSKEPIPSTRNTPAKQVPTNQPTPAKEQVPTTEMSVSEDDYSDDDESCDSDSSSDTRPKGSPEVYCPDDKGSKEGLETPAKAGVSMPVNGWTPTAAPIPTHRELYPEEYLSSDSDSSSDDEMSCDEDNYSTGEPPARNYAPVTAQSLPQPNRPFCGHCNIQGHKQQGCWRAEGRSEEEIRQMRIKLNERRKRKQRRKGGRPQKPVTPPREC